MGEGRTTSESSLKANLRVLSEQAVHKVHAGHRPLEYFAGATAVCDTERDEAITELPAFEDARTALGQLPIAQERYGAAPHREPMSERLTLQFVYGFLGNLSEPTFDPDVFETTWGAFWEELSAPEWTWMGLANLRNFRSDTYDPLDLGHGTTIRGRNPDELIAMGWREGHMERLFREWDEGGYGSHVILTEYTEPKTPDNFLGNNLRHDRKASRAVLALRLFKEGDIGMGLMWLSRRVAFDFGNLGGQAISDPRTRAAESFSAYTLDASEVPRVRDLYGMLLRLPDPPTSAPVNLDLALQSFSDIYERHSFRADTRLVDAITTVEALLGTEVEITFRLAFRVAAILGSDPDERVTIFEQMKSYYDTRSRVVHGSTLSPKQRRHLQDQQALRDMVRRLLVGFSRLTVSSEHTFDKPFFESNLDISLLDHTRRSELRAAMGLEETDSGDSHFQDPA
jgi:hypothetical protein